MLRRSDTVVSAVQTTAEEAVLLLLVKSQQRHLLKLLSSPSSTTSTTNVGLIRFDEINNYYFDVTISKNDLPLDIEFIGTLGDVRVGI